MKQCILRNYAVLAGVVNKTLKKKKERKEIVYSNKLVSAA